MRKNPLLYEINTWAWLAGLSRKYGRPITLRNVPDLEWDAITAYGYETVWLMGAWERSPAGKRIALANQGLLAEFRAALPDFSAEDFPGSPYSVRNYQCDAHLGGPAGLEEARQALTQRGMQMILDFVPNHLAPDHLWSKEHPEFFIQGSREDLVNNPNSYLKISGRVIARGRDPNSSAWADVLQLNLFNPSLRQALTQTLLDVCRQCDGVRVDMAMLAINRIFHDTWGERVGDMPADEFWPGAIQQIKKQFPDTLFIAEAYWDTERELQGLGFDLCYDKLLYDALRDENLPQLRSLLAADAGYQEKLVRFTENHDEKRAADVFPEKKLFAVNLATYSLPGARLFHQGQLEGYRIRLPVLLGRKPNEETDNPIRAFYRSMIEVLRHPAFHEGSWSLCQVDPADSPIFAWIWKHPTSWWLIAFNLSASPADAAISIDLSEVSMMKLNGRIRLSNLSDPQISPEREFEKNPLGIELGGWGYFAAELTLLSADGR